MNTPFYSALDRRPGGALLAFPIPSLPGIQFAFRLTPGTTPEQAAKLVEMLEDHCSVFMAGFLDRLDGDDDELMELYDDAGYLNPDRPLGPGDAIDRK